jgi:hypothetical protein
MMMKLSTSASIALASMLCFASACTNKNDNANTTAITTESPPPIQKLQFTQEPQRIAALRASRGEQDQAKPVLKILAPANGSQVEGPTVKVQLELSGDLKGYQPHKDATTGTGNHIHVILDDNPYEAYYDLAEPFELKDVIPGKHVLRVFASRPWHESYKNEGSFQMVIFTVKGSGDASKPTTTNTSQTPIEIDPNRPLLTYSRPKGEYKDAESDPIMIDFWLTNAKLRGDGGEYRVRYIIDDDEPRLLDKWEPIWLAGWLKGKHTVRLELLGPDQYPVKNGTFNVTTREITVIK